MRIIISICTFLLLFQISTQLLTTSEETDNDDDYEEGDSNVTCSSSDTDSDSDSDSDSDTDSDSDSDSDSSISSSEEETAKFGLAALKKLDSAHRKQFVQNFLMHLMALAELQAEERLITCAMRHHLPDIFKAKINHTETWKKLLKMVEQGSDVLHKIIEHKKNITHSEKSSKNRDVVQFFQNAWEKLEERKYKEAMSLFEKIGELIVNLGKKLVPTLNEQRKAAFAIDGLIDKRTNKINEQSRELREKFEAMPIVKSQNASITTFAAPWMLNADDIESIKKQYEEMINVIPDSKHPEAIKLKGILKEEGMSVPYFCKTLAEMQNMVGKFHSCMLQNDEVGTEILKDTLQQPDYKKCWNIFQECALNLMPVNDTLKDKLRKQANGFLFDTSKL